MTPEDVRKYYRTPYNMQKETGLWGGNLFNWIRMGFVPASAQQEIEQITKHALKVGRPFSDPIKTKEAAKKSLKRKLLKLTNAFMDKYSPCDAVRGFPNADYALIDVLEECLLELKYG
jgi:hypothetical protein